MTYVTGSSVAQGPGWWLASDHKWYPPELHPDFGKASTSSFASTKSETEVASSADHEAKAKSAVEVIEKTRAQSGASTSASNSEGARASTSGLYERELPLGSHLVLLGGGSPEGRFSPVSGGTLRLPSSERVKELVAEFMARTGKKQRMIFLAVLFGAVIAENVAAMLLHVH